MKGTGRSIREERDLSYLEHCKEVSTLLIRIDQWDWKDFIEIWTDAGRSLINGIFWVFALVLFPVIVPVAAFTRKRHAKKLWDSWEKRREKVMN